MIEAVCGNVERHGVALIELGGYSFSAKTREQ